MLKSTRHQKTEGFTLPEVMISAGLLGLVVAAAFTAFFHASHLSRAGGYQVNNQVGVTNRRCDLQGAFGLDQLDIFNMVFLEEFAGQVREFGGHTKRSVLGFSPSD